MNIGKIITQLKNISLGLKSLLNSLQLQLFISFISLPFLIAWGLPISLMSPISTLLFGPFLTIFLLISSLLFFLELFYLPNTILVWLLEKTTSIWISCLQLEQRAWLISFCKPPSIVLFFIPFIALAIIHSKKITCAIRRAILLALFLILTCSLLKFFPYRHHPYEKIPCNKGEITLINHNKILCLIDPGYMAARPSYESFISYTLVPEIIQKTGKLEIDHVIICKFNQRILQALTFLASKITIKNIYIPYWNGKISHFTWRSYTQLKKTVAENNGKVFSISYTKKLNLDEKNILLIEPVTTKKIAYQDATYYPLSITPIFL